MGDRRTGAHPCTRTLTGRGGASPSRCDPWFQAGWGRGAGQLRLGRLGGGDVSATKARQGGETRARDHPNGFIRAAPFGSARPGGAPRLGAASGHGRGPPVSGSFEGSFARPTWRVRFGWYGRQAPPIGETHADRSCPDGPERRAPGPARQRRRPAGGAGGPSDSWPWARRHSGPGRDPGGRGAGPTRRARRRLRSDPRGDDAAGSRCGRSDRAHVPRPGAVRPVGHPLQRPRRRAGVARPSGAGAGARCVCGRRVEGSASGRR